MPHFNNPSIANSTEPVPRFVVLHHTGFGAEHFDLMFESAATAPRLVTFRTPQWPVERGDVLLKLADHRARYLNYEGPIADGRGSVARVASGWVRHCGLKPTQHDLCLCYDLNERPVTLQLQLRWESTDSWIAQIALLTTSGSESSRN